MRYFISLVLIFMVLGACDEHRIPSIADSQRSFPYTVKEVRSPSPECSMEIINDGIARRDCQNQKSQNQKKCMIEKIYIKDGTLQFENTECANSCDKCKGTDFNKPLSTDACQKCHAMGANNDDCVWNGRGVIKEYRGEPPMIQRHSGVALTLKSPIQWQGSQITKCLPNSVFLPSR